MNKETGLSNLPQPLLEWPANTFCMQCAALQTTARNDSSKVCRSFEK
jgi:hypothetical protein